MTTVIYAYVKIDSNTLEVTKTVTEVTTTVTQYKRADLLATKTAIQTQRDQQAVTRNAEIAELNAFILAAQ
jgi:hypothetical protein